MDKVIITLFNEPSLGLYYTQQHIDNSFIHLLYNMVRIMFEYRISFMIIGS
jgi:hypothetical protein